MISSRTAFVIVALAAGLFAIPANATSISDAYRKLFEKQFCDVQASSDDQGEIDDEFLDINITSEDVAPLLEQLNAEFAADPVAFCQPNSPRSAEGTQD